MQNQSQRRRINYHVDPNIAGEEWYDSFMVNFDDAMYPGSYSWFLQLHSSGIPTKATSTIPTI